MAVQWRIQACHTQSTGEKTRPMVRLYFKPQICLSVGRAGTIQLLFLYTDLLHLWFPDETTTPVHLRARLKFIGIWKTKGESNASLGIFRAYLNLPGGEDEKHDKPSQTLLQRGQMFWLAPHLSSLRKSKLLISILKTCHIA